MAIPLGDFFRAFSIAIQLCIGIYLLFRSDELSTKFQRRSLQYFGLTFILSSLVMLPDVLYYPLEHFFIPDSTFQAVFFSLLVVRTFNPNPDNHKYFLHRSIFGSWFLLVVTSRLFFELIWETIWILGIISIPLYTIIIIFSGFKNMESTFKNPHPDFFFLQPKAYLFTGLAVIFAYSVSVITLILKPILGDNRFIIQDLALLISVLIVSATIISDLSERSKIMQQKQKKLVKEITNVNKELKSFAYVISHDLKAPLRSINALIGWLDEDLNNKLSKKEEEYFMEIKNQTIRMSTLIDDVLAYSQAAIDKEDKIEINLNTIVNEVVMLLNIPNNIELVISKPLPIVFFGKTRIKQVFLNLLQNAIKFNDKTKGRIIIDYHEIKGNKRSFFEFSIKDNGIGIREENFDDIFQLFVSLNPIKDSRNTGLGLSIVKRIIEIYEGKIWVESEFGKGSTFYFTLWKDS